MHCVYLSRHCWENQALPSDSTGKGQLEIDSGLSSPICDPSAFADFNLYPLGAVNNYYEHNSFSEFYEPF